MPEICTFTAAAPALEWINNLQFCHLVYDVITQTGNTNKGMCTFKGVFNNEMGVIVEQKCTLNPSYMVSYGNPWHVWHI